MNKTKHIFQVRPGETRIVLIMGFALLANSLAMQVSGIVAISGFLNSGGVNQILLVLFIDYGLILIVGALQALVIDKYDRISLIRWVTLAFALCFVILRLMFYFEAPEWLNYSIMYFLAEQQFILFPLVFWVLANDIFKMSQAKRLFPLISSWNFVGKLFGIGIAAVSPTLFLQFGINPEEILILNILIYLLAYVFLLVGLRNTKVRHTVHHKESLGETLREGWDFMKNVPSFRYMIHAIIALAIADTIIEFQFLVVTDSVFQDQASYQTFFSLYRLGTTLIALILQVLVTSIVIKYMQLKNTFLIFPVVAVIGAISMILIPGVSVAIAAMVGVKLIRDTINETGRKNLQGLIPEERRGRVSTLMESYLPSIGTMLACIIAGGIVYAGVQLNIDLTAFYLIVAAAGGGYAVWAIMKLRTVYDASLFNWRLKRRQRNADSISTLLKKVEGS